MHVSALYTDLYELTMMQGYLATNHNPQVVFDMFYRNNPFDGGYAVFAGVNDLIDKLEHFSFDKEDIDYLASLGTFKKPFLEYLATYRFHANVYAFREGSIVFPGEPLVRIHTDLVEAQLIEGIVLNTINFQTLIATKAARMCRAAKDSAIMEFGLRRAQGDGAMAASRAAYIGGCAITSNTLAGKVYGIPVGGTMAHSWVMSFSSELEAFRKFAELYPDNAVLLIDTYDVLRSGIENAITVGLEQKKKGTKIGVRIDSGDLSYLPKEVRKKLDAAGLADATITVSNDLTEDIVQQLVESGTPINSWGIGTHLVTGGFQSSLNGVYKLAAKAGEDGKMIPTMKISNTTAKTTNPGIKQVYRFSDADGQALADLVALQSEEIAAGQKYTFYHPFSEADFFQMKPGAYAKAEPMLVKQMEDGKRLLPEPKLKDLQQEVKENLKAFHPTYLRLINPHIYKVSLSQQLKNLKFGLIVQERERQFQEN